MRAKFRRRPARNRVLAQLERFEAMAPPSALATVRELLAKAGVLLRASRDQVKVIRHGVATTIDTWGRLV